MPWSFGGQTLTVLDDPPPERTGGHEFDIIECPGVDGAEFIADRRRQVEWRLRVAAFGPAEIALLEGLFNSGVEDDFERPRGIDHWVYSRSVVVAPVTFRPLREAIVIGGVLIRGDIEVADIQVTCGDPRPRWKSTGERVF
jgi:hypothetical protein